LGDEVQIQKHIICISLAIEMPQNTTASVNTVTRIFALIIHQ